MQIRPGNQPPIADPSKPGNPAPGSPSEKKTRHWTRFLGSRAALKRIAILLLSLLLVVLFLAWYSAAMPGNSFRGPLAPASPAQLALAAKLRAHVETFASTIGGRSTFSPRTGAAAAKYIKETLLAAGYPEVNETFVQRGSRVPNLEVILPGTSPNLPCIVIGAHYDSFQGTPGADDNASGCAAVLELAQRFKAASTAATPAAAGTRPVQAVALPLRSIRFVFFVNEEPPSFQTPDMGSWVYAKDLRSRTIDVHAMLSIEAIGYYRTEPNSQGYPVAALKNLYPSTGDFIGFIGDLSSRSLVRRAIGAFRESTQFPSEGASLYGGIAGVLWSDHWAFRQESYPAIMVTGTATFRNPNYHTAGDTPDTLDYDRMSRVVEGLETVTRTLADEP